MEKLLDLLQEFYGDNRTFSNENWLLTMTNWVENLSGAYAKTYIISRLGGFIKRLVENDKIEKTHLFFNTDLKDDDVSKLLQVLSISDTPIDDLISYLQ